MQKKLSKILGILGSVLLLSQPLVQVQTAGAATTDSPVKSVATGKKQLENQLRSASSKRKEQINQKYFNAVKDQLAARGADVSNLNLEQVKDQPVKVIVELKSQPAFKENIIPTGSNTSVQQIDQASNQVINQQSETKKQVENITGTKVRRKYGYLFNGFSIMAKPSQIAQIKKVNGVKNVSIAKVYYPQDNSANELANVQKVWESNHFKGEGMVIAILDTGIDPTHKDLRISEPSKEKISVNQGNNLAKTLGYGKACNDKVPFAYNYADGTDQTVWDTGTTMHGMHVAGIAAANGEGDDPINAAKGVAPEAQLLDLKVFSNTSKGATSDDLISAIEDSVKLGADIMNMSLGSTAGDVDSKDPEQIAIVNATKQGVI
ncbi:MAG: S8 family serine peptidase, partial [Lactobacillaceae bacterium]